MLNHTYVYIYLNPLKPGVYKYGEYLFEYEPFYVGKGIKQRFLSHVCESDEKCINKLKHNVINKIKKNNFDLKDYIFKLHEEITDSVACEKEIELIKLIGRRDKKLGPLTNLTDGGEGASGRFLSEEAKQKISSARKKAKMSDETKQKIRDANLGKKHSDITKQKISETNKGRVISDEHRSQVSNALKGKKKSDEHRQHISESGKGRIPWNKGKKDVYSDETREKISNSQIGRVAWNKGKKGFSAWNKGMTKQEMLDYASVEAEKATAQA